MSLQPTSVPVNFSLNTTSSPSCSEKTDSWFYTLFPVYVLVISVPGIVFNFFVLMIFLLHKKPCTVAEIYLSNLAAADLILLSSLLFYAYSIYNGFWWIFGNVMCKLVNVSIHTNVYCSIYFLVLVSIDRFMALVQPMSHEKLRTPKFAKLGCLLVWCLGLLLSVPVLVYREMTAYTYGNKTGHVCELSYRDLKTQLLCESILPIFGFLIPIPIISYCTWNIIRALKRRLTLSSTQKQEHKATTLILAVLLAFLICWVPYHIVKFMELLMHAEVLEGCTLNLVVGIIRQIFIYLAFFNSVLNPILYVIVGKTFRKKVREVFKPSAMTKSFTSSFNSTRTLQLRSSRSDFMTK